jgi:hypothetical protein
MIMRLVVAAIIVLLGTSGCAHVGGATKAPVLTDVKVVNVDDRTKTITVEHNSKPFPVDATSMASPLPRQGERIRLWVSPSPEPVALCVWAGWYTALCHAYLCGGVDGAYWKVCYTPRGAVWTQL